MFILHCTKKARDRLKVQTTEDHEATTTVLGNWYCNECTIDRRKYFVFVNEQTLLPVIISTKGVKTVSRFLDRFKQRLFKTFVLMDLDDAIFMPELLEMEEVGFAKTANRRIVGSMNEIIALAKFWPSYRGIDVESPAMFELLSQVPMKAIGNKNSASMVPNFLAEEKEPEFKLRLVR